jgi:hypothetical protein
MKKTVLLALSISWIAMEATGQGITGAQFLQIAVGPRACAMGEAYTAVADDPSAVYWNPAGITQISSLDFMFSQNFWLLDMSMQHFSGVLPTHMGNVGVGLCYSSSGEIPQIEDFLKTGTYTAYDAALNLCFARQIVKAVSIGINAKYILSQIEKVNTSTFAMDLGLLYDVAGLPGLHMGLNLQNIGPGLKFISQTDPLPLCMRLGTAYRRENLTVAAALNKYVEGENDIGLGAEYVLMKILALRIGYNTRNSLSGGFGLEFTKLDLDYAVVQFRDIDFSHVISLRIKGF